MDLMHRTSVEHRLNLNQSRASYLNGLLPKPRRVGHTQPPTPNKRHHRRFILVD